DGHVSELGPARSELRIERGQALRATSRFADLGGLQGGAPGMKNQFGIAGIERERAIKRGQRFCRCGLLVWHDFGQDTAEIRMVVRVNGKQIDGSFKCPARLPQVAKSIVCLLRSVSGGLRSC